MKLRKLTDKEMREYTKCFYLGMPVVRNRAARRVWNKPAFYKSTITLPNGSHVWIVTNSDRPTSKLWEAIGKRQSVREDIVNNAYVLYFYTEEEGKTIAREIIDDFMTNLHAQLFPHVNRATAYGLVVEKDTVLPSHETKLTGLAAKCRDRVHALRVALDIHRKNIDMHINRKNTVVSTVFRGCQLLMEGHEPYAYGYRQFYYLVRRYAWAIKMVKGDKEYLYNEEQYKNTKGVSISAGDLHGSVFLTKEEANHVLRRVRTVESKVFAKYQGWKFDKIEVVNVLDYFKVKRPPARIVTRLKVRR